MESTEDTSMGVQIEEEMSAIRAMQIVTKLWVSVRKSDRDRDGCRVSLTCFSCKEYGSCGKKQEPPVQVSSRHPTLHACLQELLKRHLVVLLLSVSWHSGALLYAKVQLLV